MTDYTELVKELRGCKYIDYCTDCPRMAANGYVEICNIKDDAAAAIEALLKENKELIEDHPEMVEADGHWKWRKPNGEAQLPKRGEWVKNRVGFGWHCSYCKVDNYYAYCWNNEMGRSELKYNYCPNCGADMRAKMEVQDDTRMV